LLALTFAIPLGGIEQRGQARPIELIANLAAKVGAGILVVENRFVFHTH